MSETDVVTDLLHFIDASPTPYHAVAEVVGRLSAAGFEALDEGELWQLEPGARRFVVRGESSVVAFEVGEQPPVEGGFHLVGAHTDSPNLRVKPLPDVSRHGVRQLGVEPYGGVLLHTWLDRDLSLAGRVTLRSDRGVETRLLDFDRPLLRVPSLAIHLFRELREQGLKLNAQQHVVPVLGLEDAPSLSELVAAELRAQSGADVAPEDILSCDLMTYDTQPSGLAGARGEFIHAPRLDNLASCHAGLVALLAAIDAGPVGFTRGVVFYDHEEVGSRSAVGAAGPLLHDVLERAVEASKGGETQGLARAMSRSTIVSADMAHAVHPNYSDRHEPEHRPKIGGGPVIKVNSNQSYASNAETSGIFAALCREAGFEPQHFVTRSDLGCGSTIGPITATRLGARTVDVGNPMLSMHSIREMAGAADVQPMVDVLGRFFTISLA